MEIRREDDLESESDTNESETDDLYASFLGIETTATTNVPMTSSVIGQLNPNIICNQTLSNYFVAYRTSLVQNSH